MIATISFAIALVILAVWTWLGNWTLLGMANRVFRVVARRVLTHNVPPGPIKYRPWYRGRHLKGTWRFTAWPGMWVRMDKPMHPSDADHPEDLS